jgi:hypothetical protein
MICREPFDDLWKDRVGVRLDVSNRLLAGCGIGQELDVPDPLLQFIECRPAAHEQSASVGCRLDPARTAIEKLYAQGMLQVGDDLRYSGMGDTEKLGCLAKASRLHHREEHPQVPQPQPTSDVVVPVGNLCHKRTLSSMKPNRDYCLYVASTMPAITPGGPKALVVIRAVGCNRRSGRTT